MGRFEIHRRRAIVIERAFPTCHAYAPLVAWLQSGKTPLGMGRDQIVTVEHGEIQKLLCGFHADRVLPHILRSRSTIAVAIKPGHRVEATTFQFCSQNIRRHKVSFTNSNRARMLSEAKHLSLFPADLVQKRSELLRFDQNDIGRCVMV